MLDKIFVTTFYISFQMHHQVIITETVQIFIIVPMAITCAFGIDLYNFSTHCHFNFFNGIKNKRTQAAVKTIKADYVLEINIVAGEVVPRIFSVLLKRISVSAKPIVTNVEKVSNSLAFVIEKETPLF